MNHFSFFLIFIYLFFHTQCAMNKAESIQERYIQLVRDITKLQWVRESIASHSKNYESLKKKIEKQLHLKEFSEREL